MLLTVLLLCIGTTAVHGKARIACPEGWFLFDKYCYYFGRGKVNIDGADDLCRDVGADLVEEVDEELGNFIKSTLKGIDTTGAVGAWLLERDYSSNYGWGFYENQYTDWANDPAPAGDGLCMFMSASKEWKWDAQDCNSRQDMITICEEDAVIKDCYESTCFLISHKLEPCEVGAGYLAKIESEEENNFVKQLLGEAETVWGSDYLWWSDGNVKIGGSDAVAEGTWVFEDGEAVLFDDFDSNEPNNAGTGEDCIVMARGRDFKWIDYTCDEFQLMILCEEPMSEIVG